MSYTSSLKSYSLTPRSILIGLLGVMIQCLVTPYNDFLVGSTYLAGNHLPIAVVFSLTVLILVVNVLLKRIKPGVIKYGRAYYHLGDDACGFRNPIFGAYALSYSSTRESVLLCNSRKRLGRSLPPTPTKLDGGQ